MDKSNGIEGGEARSGSTEEKTLGDIAILVPPQQIGELHMDDAQYANINGRWAYRGRANGLVVTRFIDTTLGHVEKSPIAIHKAMPRQ